jgi:hypothetical protein
MFALAFMATSGIIWAFASVQDRRRARLGYMVAAASLALALAGPWLWMLLLRTLLPAFERPSNMVAGGSYNAVSDGLLWAGHNRVLLALALGAALWGVARRRRAAAEQGLWVATMVLLANPILLGLPYSWLITNDVLVISLFLPVSLLIGGGACWLVESLELKWVVRSPWSVVSSPGSRDYGLETTDYRRRPRYILLYASVIVALAGLALRGAWELRSVVNPDTVFATKADVAAIAWAAEHTPADARFLIGATRWLNVYRGTDGGWWLLPLAGRWTSVPAVLYVYGAPSYVQAAGELSKAIAELPKDRPRQVHELVERERIDYIYLGSRPGPLSLEALAGDPAFEKVYEHDGVTILAVHR